MLILWSKQPILELHGNEENFRSTIFIKIFAFSTKNVVVTFRILCTEQLVRLFCV